MEEVKQAVDLYDEIKGLATKIHDLSRKICFISNSGITPYVMLTKEGFDELFPLGAIAEIKNFDDGSVWEVREVEADGIRFVDWTKR